MEDAPPRPTVATKKPDWLPPLPEGSAIPETIHIVPRDEWGACQPTDTMSYRSLPAFVRFVHTENMTPCTNDETCKKELRELQRQHISEGFPDIRFNFIIGAGGTIFEGRGWKTDIELHNRFREIQGKCLDIAYMGNYRYERPPWDMLVSAFNLLFHGINNKLLSPFFDFQHLAFE